MRFAVCFLAVACCAAALPADVPLDASQELDISDIYSMNVYVEPLNPDPVDLPGGRIIGGEEVEPNSVPYQVALLVNGGGLCGASLISTTSLLTAAHCVSGASFVEIRLGAHWFIQEEDTQVRVTSTSFVVHASYSVNSWANDIAAIFLPSAVSLNDNIQTVPLAPADSDTFAWARGFLTGWGLTSDDINGNVSPVLRGVELDVLPNGACAAIYGTIIRDSHICTSGAGVVGGCNGDSGGPLVVDGVQVGLVNFGAVACEARSPTAYARISAFRDWIEENTGV